MPLYAHRRKGVRGDSWRIFRVETEGLTGTLARLATMIALPLEPALRSRLGTRHAPQSIHWLVVLTGGRNRPTARPKQAGFASISHDGGGTEQSTDDILAELAHRRSTLLPFWVRMSIVNKACEQDQR